MGMMSVSLPVVSSALNDVLAILELASEPVKIKKLIKELNEASSEYLENKASFDLQIEKLKKTTSDLNAKASDLELIKSKCDEAKKLTDGYVKEYEAKKKELSILEEVLNARSEKIDFEKSLNDQNYFKAISLLKIKEEDLEKSKKGLDKLGIEFKEKVEKLKAVTDLME